jgi:hypothetical protein
MCIITDLESHRCGHTSQRLAPCSSTSPCWKPSHAQHRIHPGECPDCLDGNVWPNRSYIYASEGSSDLTSFDDVGRYAQSLLKYLTFEVAHLYKTLNASGQDAGHQQLGLPGGLLRLHNKRMLETYYDQHRCMHQANPPPTFGQRCDECDGQPETDTHPGSPGVHMTSNTTRQFRRDRAEEIYATDFAQAVGEGRFDGEIGEVEAEGPRHMALDDRAATVIEHVWPYSRRKVFNRFVIAAGAVEVCVDRLCSGAGDEASSPPTAEIETYVECSRRVLEAGCWLIAHDCGLGDNVLQSVIFHLAAALGYPVWNPPPVPERYSHGFEALWEEAARGAGTRGLMHYRYVVMTFSSCVDQPTEKLKAFVDETRLRLEAVRARHLDAMNRRQPLLLTARLQLYTTPSLPDDDWVCAICREGVEKGMPVKLDVCIHMYHFDCLLGCMLEMEENEWDCPLCRATADGLDASFDPFLRNLLLRGAELPEAPWEVEEEEEEDLLPQEGAQVEEGQEDDGENGGGLEGAQPDEDNNGEDDGEDEVGDMDNN